MIQINDAVHYRIKDRIFCGRVVGINGDNLYVKHFGRQAVFVNITENNVQKTGYYRSTVFGRRLVIDGRSRQEYDKQHIIR